ncbi:MAG TPA: CheR family methyltransferase [Actinomycetes bacterium]
MSVLDDADFATLRDYLRTEAGLEFDDSRRAGLTAVVADRLRTTGAGDLRTYLGALSGTAGEAERQRLLDSVTVRETHFFRNPPQMEALRRRVLPELLRRAAGRDRPLTIWSAGCSTGEEPYTLAMMLLELSPMAGSRAPTRVVGTDVSADALRAAARGTYTGRTVETMPAVVRDRWLEPRPGGALGVKDEVRRLVDLRLHNLVTDPVPFAKGEVDLVVCRNVTIYFARETTRLLMGRFHDVLAEGGYLLLGHSETLWQVSDAFTLVPVGDAFVYRRSHEGRRRLPPVPRRRRRPAPAPAAVPPGPTLLDEARGQLATGDYEAAARAAADAVAADPLLSAAYVVLGQARCTLGQDADAIDPLRKAVYLDPAAGQAHFLLAGALARLGQHGPAAVSYRAAAKAVGRMPATARDDLLGGRDVAELADLCRRLADESQRLAGQVVSAAPGGVS